MLLDEIELRKSFFKFSMIVSLESFVEPIKLKFFGIDDTAS